MSREATSEQLSVREGAGYDEVFQTGNELEPFLDVRKGNVSLFS